ncbi:similar to gi/121748847/sp/Q0UQJ8.1/STU1_PHANO RecName: Full=Protein STU1 [Plenodomus lingam JN3]|uniref:Lm_SuperContig_12_v2 genomic supercontig, whole genome, isolate v23.1.3 n=2 Tax=Leptosphaeria maculans TaxID=5022 RepID=E5A6L6_LEPMJ|nr:similar to gi/121748847/sp/Q0UQJ8.1/STU1_PHANO RecName: Full=Protein STU1 [Plenodomus lingam JN3]CBX99261.1 similar to gi/121748847/sp/Q0UQJ8.1/STU1_PHANO RecName: Full=Protein STU1 [Plenodomus lingam JN3]
MESEAATLLSALKKPSTNVEQRLALFTTLKSSIKHNRVPEECQATIFECIRLAITAATSAALVQTGFSTLSHFIKRLQLQKETQVITAQSSVLCSILADKLGDARESHRTAALQILADLHNLCPTEVDTLIHEAMKGSNARAKDTSMSWVVKMNKSEGLPFKSYSNQLVANLEDADAGVRDTAKKAVVELFGHAPEHAKANLKKQLVALNVRKAIATYITSHLDAEAIAKDTEMPAATAAAPASAPASRPISKQRAEALQPDVGFADEAPPPTETVVMDPIHIYTQRELEDVFRDMLPCYEGRESETNWLARDKNCTKLRRILKGNAPHDFHAAFIAGIKSLLDGILKVANTLRTTMSTNGCLLVQELAKTLGSAIDPWVEILMQSFVKMCAATKNIAAQNGNATVEVILQHVSYSSRLLHHVVMASQDKNVQPRTHSASWAKTLIRKHNSHIEHSGGLDSLDKLIRRGVTDANPKVREAYRSTYWVFALVWPQRGEIIFDTLEKREKTALEKDPNNPNASMASSQTSTASFSKSVGPGASRNALKEKIAEQRRAKLAAAKGVPERPNSAAASYTPAKSLSSKSLGAGSRTTSTLSTAPSASLRPPSAMAGESTKSALKSSTTTGSLMSGTVRRPIRRPEINRPATADPYAVRRAAGGKATPSMTPEKTPAATTTAKKAAVPKNTARPRAQTQNSPTGSPARSKSRIGQPVAGSKGTGGTSRHASPAASPARDEELTMVKPWVRSQSQHDPATIPFRQRNGLNTSQLADSEAIEDDDNFTMVIPSLGRPMSQAVQRTPPKPAPSAGRLPVPSPRASLLRSPKSMGHIEGSGFRSSTRSPRVRSPDRPSTRGTDADEVQVYEDPFVGEEPAAADQTREKPVLEELPINEKSNERRHSTESASSDIIMDNGGEERPRGHQKTASTGSVLFTEREETPNAEVLKNRQLLASGIKKIEGRTVEAHMFRRMQDMVKSNQEIWGPNDENFGRLLLACLDFLEFPIQDLKGPPLKAMNLKVQALATIRALLALYRKETAQYFGRVLCAILRTKAQYENTSHIAVDLEATADEIVKYGQTTDCLNAVLSLIEATPPSSPSSSPNSRSSTNSLACTTTAAATRTTTMALSTLASLVEISGAKNVTLSAEQTSRLGKLAVRCMDDPDADVRKADIEFCVKLHERIAKKGPVDSKEDGGFWKAVAGASEQHLNLLTYYLAKRGVA